MTALATSEEETGSMDKLGGKFQAAWSIEPEVTDMKKAAEGGTVAQMRI